jgi:parallel beta-helix repeat protein
VVIRGDSRRTSARIENVEISQCGKEQYMYDGMYEDCMRVEIDGPADSSIIRNTAIYDGYGRGLYIPKSLELTVDSNVIAFTAAECIYVGGVESSITITNNLLMNTRRLQGKRDTSLNVLYLAGPSSYVEGNHLAGGPAFGIHYDTSPDREGTCPWGLPLGRNQGNFLHSFYDNWAIYIEKLSPRSDPCGSEGTYSWSLDSLTVYRNRYGIYIHDSGKLIVENCVFADNGKSLHISYDGMTTEKSKVMNTSFFGALDPTQDPSQVMLHLP